MITILKNFLASRESRKNVLAEKLEEEQRALEEEIDKENVDANAQPTSCMQNVIQNAKNSEDNQQLKQDKEENNKCFMKTGKIHILWLS